MEDCRQCDGDGTQYLPARPAIRSYAPPVRHCSPPGSSPIVGATTVLTLGVVVLGTLLTGCARRHDMAEARTRMHVDTRLVLRTSAERLAPPGTRPLVYGAATLPCVPGEARAFLKGQIPLESGPATRVALDRARQLVLDLFRGRGYRLRTIQPGGRHRRSVTRSRRFTMTRRTPTVHVTVRLAARPRPVLILDAFTPCMRR